MSGPAAEGWQGYHLFYHGDRDRLLQELVRPLVASLVADGLIRRFFCIRYNLGGPHVRLRVEADAVAAPVAAERVRASAEAFFREVPSVQARAPERVRSENATILPEDSLAGPEDDVVYPDNSLVEHPVRFELERYGGPGRMQDSLDFFTVSTVESIRFLGATAGASKGQRMAAMARILAGLAWDLAEDHGEFVPLAAYAVATMGDRMPAILPMADAAFEGARETHCALARGAVAATGPGAEPLLSLAARGLADRVRDSPRHVRMAIATGQMHMTSNRLGLLNGEEIYLCRILARVIEQVEREDPGFWRSAWERRRDRAPAPPLADSMRASVEAMVAENARSGRGAAELAAVPAGSAG